MHMAIHKLGITFDIIWNTASFCPTNNRKLFWPSSNNKLS